MADRTRFALASSRVVTPHEVRAAALIIDGGRIEAVVRREDVPAGVPVEDLGDLVISPGVIDSHVHVNEPGRTEWEGFETATRAAAAGGVTTIVDMPLNSSPVTTTVAALDAKRQAAAGKCWVDVGFYGGLVPGNLPHIEPLIDAGVCGVKAFLCDSGLPEFPAASESDLRVAMPVLARRGVPLLVHAELPEAPSGDLSDPRSYEEYEASRPPSWEARAVQMLAKLCLETHCRVHVVHRSSQEAMPCGIDSKQYRMLKAIGFTFETCPHYLTFSKQWIRDGDTRFKCAPPIRDEAQRSVLWRDLEYGVISTIGSDHSPCPPPMKLMETGDFQHAWGGVSSLQLTLSAIWTGASFRDLPLSMLANWLSQNPADLIGLVHQKGGISSGRDADLCVWDPEEQWTVVGAELHHRHKLTPYEGENLRGRVKRTYVRGQLAFDEGEFPTGPVGELLRRGKR